MFVPADFDPPARFEMEHFVLVPPELDGRAEMREETGAGRGAAGRCMSTVGQKA